MSKKNKNKSKQPPAETGHDFRAEKPEGKIFYIRPFPASPTEFPAIGAEEKLQDTKT